MKTQKINHPIQPLELDSDKVLRFKQNAIVRWVLDEGEKHGIGMNEIARMGFSREDRVQFAQLIGYSLSGFGDLSYVDNDTYEAAALTQYGLSSEQAQIQALTEKLDALRESIRGLTAIAFRIYPEDLEE